MPLKYARKAMDENQWRLKDVRSCLLVGDSCHPFEFFGGEPISGLGQFSLGFLNNKDLEPTADMSVQEQRILNFLQLTLSKNYWDVYPGHRFTKTLLQTLGYEEGNIILHTQFPIPYEISSEARHYAQTDVCLVQGSMILMAVIQDDTSLPNSRSAEAQLIAAAIAAYTRNNDTREKHRLEKTPTMTIPCILMRKTRPTFYLVPVSEDLSLSVMCGTIPNGSTHFSKCSIGNDTNDGDVGMEHPKYRKLALQHLEEFKTLAKSHWEKLALPRSRKRRRTQSSDSLTEHPSD